jgi:cell wall assembly regulator SMI1
MNITTKFQKIIDIQKNNSEEAIGTLNNAISSSDIQKIESLLEEQLPLEITELYSFANGQNDSGNGILFGESFCSADEIIRQLEFSRTLIKSGTKTITNPEQSDRLIKQIVDFYVSKTPKNKLFGLKKSWYKLEFECGPNSFGGPYIYATENTTDREREILEIDVDQISETVKKLHEIEQPTYKWDELKFLVYSNGKYEIERSAYDFDNEISFTSTPKSAIQKKYFHYKWLPIFSDYGGNYIGIDLDPDTKGKKGQVINFGRDEEDMFVLAENLDDLFDKLLAELDKTENRLLNSENHLHETLKEMTKKQ